MKVILAGVFITGLVLTSKIGSTRERGLEEQPEPSRVLYIRNDCAPEHRGEEAYLWDLSAKRWILVGHQCGKPEN